MSSALSVWLPTFNTAKTQLRKSLYSSLLVDCCKRSISTCDKSDILPCGDNEIRINPFVLLSFLIINNNFVSAILLGNIKGLVSSLECAFYRIVARVDRCTNGNGDTNVIVFKFKRYCLNFIFSVLQWLCKAAGFCLR